MSTMPTFRARRQRGLTMIELIMFIVIVGIAVVGVLQVIALTTSRSADPIRRKQAMAIAEGLMDEIRAARFTYCDAADDSAPAATSAASCKVPEGPGQEPNGSARPFDNVNDYVTAYGTAQAYGADVIGTPYPADYNVSVTITAPASLGPGAAAVPAGAVLRIVVTVGYGTDGVTLESYRTRYAPTFQ